MQIKPNQASEQFFPEKYFLASQLGWIEDNAPLKIIQKSRQVGITYADAYDSVCKVTSSLGAPASRRPPPCPPDLEQAAVEQVAFWFQKREKLGLKTYWPSGVRYEQFAEFDLLEGVRATLSRHERWSL